MLLKPNFSFLIHFIFKDSKTRRKHLRSLASLHYEKALKLFSPNHNPLEYLRLLVEEVALADFELQSKNYLFYFSKYPSFEFK
jgi:hypothetical protein